MMWVWLALSTAVLILAAEGAAHAAVRFAGKIWLRHWSGRRHKDMASVAILSDPDRLAASAKVTIAMAALAAGIVLGAELGADRKQLLVTAGIFLAFATALGRWAPHMAARRWPHVLAPMLMPFLEFTAKFVAPLRASAAIVARRPDAPESAHALQAVDVQNLLREGESEGAGEPEEMDIISGIMQFGDKTLRDVMTPRGEIFGVDAADPALDAARQAAASGYSRIPVYRESLDQIVGMLHVFDLLSSGGNAMPAIREVGYAPGSKLCSEMLFEMLSAQRHLTVVLDDAGATAGIVTLHDVLEELVGEIQDEHDGPSGRLSESVRTPLVKIAPQRAGAAISLESFPAP